MVQPRSRSTPARKRTRTPGGPKPDVILDVIFDRGALFLAIQNIGPVPALKVKTTFDHPVMGLGGALEVSALPLFQNIEFLAPHKSISTFLDSSTAYFGRGEPTRITANLFYTDSRRRHYHSTVHHDLEIYKDLGYLSWPPGATGLPDPSSPTQE